MTVSKNTRPGRLGGCRPDPAACRDLRDKFLAAAAAGGPGGPEGAGGEAGGWLAVWRLLLEHPWSRRVLDEAARSAVRRVGGPVGWAEDVGQDAALRLAKSLRRDPSLGYDPRRPDVRFSRWLDRVLRNACRSAVRRQRRLSRESWLSDGAAVRLPGRAADRAEVREATVDLYLAIEQLPDPGRSVLLLIAKGLTLDETAGRLGLSYWQAWRTCRDGRLRLRTLLGGGEDAA